MTIDLLTLAFSILIGLAVGFFAGMFGAHHSADQFAKKIFDAMMLLRNQAKRQMDDYDDAKKPTKEGKKS